jgi:hypothetical protein
VDLATLNRRLDARPDEEWGGGPTERALIERFHASGEDVPDGVAVDANAPLDRVVDAILARCDLDSDPAADPG